VHRENVEVLVTRIMLLSAGGSLTCSVTCLTNALPPDPWLAQDAIVVTEYCRPSAPVAELVVVLDVGVGLQAGGMLAYEVFRYVSICLSARAAAVEM
jgi:hypothetical protein